MPSGIVGREAELASSETFLREIGRGSRALILEGEPGIGKTTVWRALCERAVELGCRVLSCKAAQAEAKLSFAGVADLLSEVDPEALERLPPPQRWAIDVALLRAEPGKRALDRRALFSAFVAVLLSTAQSGPVVVAVDDLQWLDRPSQAALDFAVRRWGSKAIGLVATTRTGEQSAPDAGLRRTLREIGSQVVPLGPMSVGALHKLIASSLGHSFARPTVVKIARASAGNPFYALEIGRELLARGRLASLDPLPVPADLSELVVNRLNDLPSRTRDALLTAAALADPTSEQVGRRALAAAVDAGLVEERGDRVSFTHPLFASAVYAAADARRRRQLHQRLAELVLDPEERARHLALGSLGPDEKIAAQLDSAAVAAGSRGAPDGAADLIGLAIRLTPKANSIERVERQIAASRFHLDAGDLTRAQAVVEAALSEAHQGAGRARALQLLGEIRSRNSDFAEALSLANQALDAAASDGLLRAAIELDIAFCLASLGDFPSAVVHAEAAVGLAEVAGGEGLLADALAALSIAEFLSGRGFAESRMARALELEEPLRSRPILIHPRLIHGVLLLWTGRLDEAVATLDGLRTEAIQRGQDSAVPLLSIYLVWACLWRGDLVGAARFVEESRQVAAMLDDRMSTANTLAASALVRAHLGLTDLARADALQSLALYEQLQWRPGTIWPLWALGFIELSSGNPAGVDAILTPLSEMLVAVGLAEPTLGVFLPDHIDALIALGRLERAEPLIALLEQRGRDFDRPWALAVAARGRGLLLAAQGNTDEALATIDRALVQHGRMTMPFELGRTLLVKGRIERRAKKKRAAADSLRRAMALFAQLPAPLWIEQARSEMERLGRRALQPDQLTASERAVAELAAAGFSNSEVARRAFLTVKAVEANLTRAYDKLGIRSRAGLARALEAGKAKPGKPV